MLNIAVLVSGGGTNLQALLDSEARGENPNGKIRLVVVKTGESKEPIYYTSKVECYYKGTFIDGTVFDDKSFEAGEIGRASCRERV